MDGPRAKVERAAENINLLNSAVGRFFETGPYEIVGEFDAECSQYVWSVKITQQPPLELGVMLGEAVHNLRSALDLLVWQLVLLNAGVPSRENYFVVARSKAEFDRRAGVRLQGIADAHFAFIEKLQPYHAGGRADGHFLVLLSWLSNTDKHRVIHPMYGYFRPEPPPQLVFVPNRDAEPLGRQWLADGRRMRDGAKLARVEIEPVGPDPRVEMYGDLIVDIAFGDRWLRADAVAEVAGLVNELVEAFSEAFDR